MICTAYQIVEPRPDYTHFRARPRKLKLPNCFERTELAVHP